jgi:hypothetical protein
MTVKISAGGPTMPDLDRKKIAAEWAAWIWLRSLDRSAWAEMGELPARDG